MWKLVIEDDEGKRTVVPLTRDDYSIGRQEGNTIRLTERNVSREHGRIKRKRANGAAGANGSGKDLFFLEDRSSYNGLFVNGLRVAHTQDLQHGDLIQIGDYRIVLQDDAAGADTATIPITHHDVPQHDVKATIPMAAAFRGQDLTDRPSRFVMLVGPTPGVEYPLDRERMTIGRAEESTISVNHNSVSRLHCEVHALGDGRYEIVDKGSSNGVRVNAVELKRSIIEAGDVIELGDVRFKFVGAGQVFVPGPNESQQLTAISDRDAELADPRRAKGWGGYALPILGAGIVGALIILGFVYLLRARANADVPPNGAVAAPADSDQALVMEAKKTCTPDDCDGAYAQVSTLPDRSPWRDSIDFRQIESMWAESIIKKSRGVEDPGQRRLILSRVALAKTLDDAHKKQLAAELATLDQPGSSASTAPSTSASLGAVPSGVTSPPAPQPSTTARTTPVAHPTATATPVVTTPTPIATPKATGTGPTAFEKAAKMAFEGRDQEVRNLLEGKVRAGRASTDEARLVREACKKMHDTACVDDVKAKYP
ncbi:MAG: Adenylate cyclase [Labilithrix sp.]|nr:Adenylate cyclase [Labilithrix sp.]